MPPLTIAAFAHALSETTSVFDALRLLRGQLDEIARGLQVVYLRSDARRQLVIERLRVNEQGVTREPVELSLDHLPPRLKRDVLAGGALVDVGEQSADYLKFFGMENGSDAFLLLQGIRFEGDLAGVVAVREPKQRFGARVLERIAAPVGVFSLAVAHAAERAARKDAEAAVESLTARMHDEYGHTLIDLRRQLADAQRKLSGGAGDARVVELEKALTVAADEARTTRERLTAVEQQVAAAVAQLEKAHLDLSRQSESLRNQGALLHRIERLLQSKDDPQRVLEEVLAAVSSR